MEIRRPVEHCRTPLISYEVMMVLRINNCSELPKTAHDRKVLLSVWANAGSDGVAHLQIQILRMRFTQPRARANRSRFWYQA